MIASATITWLSVSMAWSHIWVRPPSPPGTSPITAIANMQPATVSASRQPPLSQPIRPIRPTTTSHGSHTRNSRSGSMHVGDEEVADRLRAADDRDVVAEVVADPFDDVVDHRLDVDDERVREGRAADQPVSRA